MKALDVVDGMARWIIVHGEASSRSADPPAAADADSSSGKFGSSRRLLFTRRARLLLRPPMCQT